jgi:hypothetical protein
MGDTNLSYHEWLEVGLRSGFISPPVCYTHDGLPMTEEEDTEFYEGGDPCVFVIRPYESEEQKKNVEENHAPSVWRNHLPERR